MISSLEYPICHGHCELELRSDLTVGHNGVVACPLRFELGDPSTYITLVRPPVL